MYRQQGLAQIHRAAALRFWQPLLRKNANRISTNVRSFSEAPDCSEISYQSRNHVCHFLLFMLWHMKMIGVQDSSYVARQYWKSHELTNTIAKHNQHFMNFMQIIVCCVTDEIVNPTFWYHTVGIQNWYFTRNCPSGTLIIRKTKMPNELHSFYKKNTISVANLQPDIRLVVRVER